MSSEDSSSSALDRPPLLPDEPAAGNAAASSAAASGARPSPSSSRAGRGARASSLKSASNAGASASESESGSAAATKTYDVATASALHVAAANASDAIKENLNSALAVLRELLVLGPTSSGATATAAAGAAAGAGGDEAAGDESRTPTSGGSKRRPKKTDTARRTAWLEARDPDGCTALAVAASAGNSIAAQLLLDAGANVDAADIDGATPLHKACANAHVTTILVLLRANATRDAADAAGRTPLHYAVDRDAVDALDALLVGASNLPLLSPRAAKAGATGGDDACRALLGAADAAGMTALHRVARCGARKCMTRVRARYAALLPRGAVDARDASGLAPIHHAALAGSASCVRQLTALGADVGARVDLAGAAAAGAAAGFTPAHLAALVGSRAALQALGLARAALLVAPDAAGRTPRDIALGVGAVGASCAKWLAARAAADADLTTAEESAITTTPTAPATPAGGLASPRAMSTLELQSVNRWGFVDVEGTEFVYEPSEADIRKEVLRAMKWMKMFDEWDGKFRGSDKLAERIDKGVPDAVRALAWMRLANATPTQRPANVYASLLPLASPHGSQIKKDIHRTFPRHVLFRDAEGSGQQALFNVLKNYSLYDPKTGYCQGMGFLAGVLLMYMTEEDAFWMLVRIASDYEMAGMWEDAFPHLARGKFVVERLLEQHMPRIAAHLADEGLALGIVADKWFLGWFLYTMPFHVVLRIWDALLGHGFLYIYRIILAIFKIRHDEILDAPFEEITSILRFEGEAASPVDVDRLFVVARGLKLRDEQLLALHSEWAASQQKR